MEELLKQILAELQKLNTSISAAVMAAPRVTGMRPEGMPPNMAEMMKRRIAARQGRAVLGTPPSAPSDTGKK